MPRPSGNPAFLSRREHSGSGYDQNADFDHNHKTVIAIYTHSRDFTFQRSLPELLSLYTEFYPQEQAIQHLLMHLEIDGYFNALPTPEEMNILFSIHQTPHMDEA